MTNFDYKKFLKENKSTFYSSLNEGQFSWFTQDTEEQIGSEKENTLPFVYMHDDKGNKWLEKNYEGYGEFGGKDYYELLDQMNGGDGDRSEGISKAFNVALKGKIKFPALTVSATLPSGHNFTEEAEHDPNQSWYQEPEDDDDEYSSWRDEEDDEYLDESKIEEKPKTKMKKSELKEMIKAAMMAEAELNVNTSDETPENEEDFLAEIEAILAEADEEEAIADEETDTEVTDDEEVDAEAGGEEVETTDTETTAEVNPNVKAVQDSLTQAQAAAKALGDAKLTDQIGNTITFFTRTHVASIDKGVAEAVVDATSGDEGEEDVTSIDPQSAAKIGMEENLNEAMFPMLKKILK